MKSIKTILFLLSSVAFSFSIMANNPLEIRAEKAYAEKKYDQVITLYEAILKDGYTSFKLYYNLGNAYYKNNELGKAIYHYELAKKIEPTNQDVKTNLIIANEKTIDKIESKENFFIGAIKSSLVNSLSTTGWALLSIFSLTGSLIFVFMFLVSKHALLKRIGFFVSGLLLFTTITAMVSGYSALKNNQELNFAIIINHETKIHEEPNSVSKTKFSLHEGAKVSVVEATKEWTNIKLENGNEGWMRTEELGLF